MSAAIASGLGRYVLERAVAYARERKVFNVPIGAHQGLSHPMALAAAHLELASLMTRKAAWLFDAGKAAGAEANMAKMAAADAGLDACDIAIQTHGGNGFTREFEVVHLLAAPPPPQDGARVARDDPQLHRRARAGATSKLLN